MPDQYTDVYINSGTVIQNFNVIIRSINLGTDVNFTIKSGFSLTVTK